MGNTRKKGKKMNEELTVRYYYDTILERNVYGVTPKEDEVEEMEYIAKLYRELSKDSKEYIMVRLEMIKDNK